jgi:hypothetical protein
LRRGILAFALVAAGFAGLGHLAWRLDWDGAQTGSSTSALMLLFLPFWALLLGGLAAGGVPLGGLVWDGWRRRRGRPGPRG